MYYSSPFSSKIVFFQTKKQRAHWRFSCCISLTLFCRIHHSMFYREVQVLLYTIYTFLTLSTIKKWCNFRDCHKKISMCSVFVSVSLTDTWVVLLVDLIFCGKWAVKMRKWESTNTKTNTIWRVLKMWTQYSTNVWNDGMIIVLIIYLRSLKVTELWWNNSNKYETSPSSLTMCLLKSLLYYHLCQIFIWKVTEVVK